MKKIHRCTRHRTSENKCRISGEDWIAISEYPLCEKK